jgi:hypothetical protein
MLKREVSEMASPTFSQTYTSLCRIQDVCASAIYELGILKGRCVDDDAELLHHVVAWSKAILGNLPCLQLENDRIEELDSIYSVALSDMLEGID